MTPQSLGLDVVEHVRVPRELVEEIQQYFRTAGRRGNEAVGFWAGTQQETHFVVTAVYLPGQRAGNLGGGCVVMVDGDELFRMNVWLHENRLTLIAQLHSHPGDAYHSDTDDDYPVMTRTGGLSLVIPDYARDAFSLATAAVYRLTANIGWQHLSEPEVAALIQVVEDDA